MPKIFLKYTLGVAVILGWWYAAFVARSEVSVKETPKPAFAKSKTAIHLAPIDRNILHKALSGDIALMMQLIGDWDIDAQLMELAGCNSTKRLSSQEYLRSQVLGRQLLSQRDKGAPRVLPQTYVATSFLLALVEPEHIVALPKGLREQKQLFSPKLTGKIPLDIDRYHAETLFLASPDIAFVAQYSHPAIVQALKNQGTSLITLNAGNCLKEIQESLLQAGVAVNRSLKAELLSLFMEAAMQAIDNRLSLANAKSEILFVNFHTQFSLPTIQTLSGQLLKRMGLFVDTSEGWTIPLNREQLFQRNPYGVIICSLDPAKTKMQLAQDAALAQLAAIQENRVVFVDETVQQFPSQYLVLAYYDIASAVMEM